jgi:hypothetical protein
VIALPVKLTSAAGVRGKNGIAEAFEERFLAIQHVLVVVDTEKDCVLECRINRRGHGSPSNNFLHFDSGNCSKLHTPCYLQHCPKSLPLARGSIVKGTDECILGTALSFTLEDGAFYNSDTILDAFPLP